MLKLILITLVILSVVIVALSFRAHGQKRLHDWALFLLAVHTTLLIILWVNVDQFQFESPTLMLRPSGNGGQTCTLT